MEVKEAIELISQLLNTDWDNDVDENGRSYKKTREDLISLLKSLESENKKLKKENEAYKGMWKELKPTDDYEALILEEKNLLSTMSKLEQKYLNNGENNGTEKY